MKVYATIFALVLGFSHQALAEKITPAQVDEARLYVEQEMHVTHPQVKNLPAPIIDQDSDHFMRFVTRMEHRPAREIDAFYYYGTIYMRNVPVQMAELVHEMVHHAQEAFALSYPCTASREREAYDLQNKYARAHDLLEQTVPQSHIDRVSKCTEETR